MGHPAGTSRSGRSAVGLPQEMLRQRHDRILNEIDAVLADIEATLEHCRRSGRA